MYGAPTKNVSARKINGTRSFVPEQWFRSTQAEAYQLITVRMRNDSLRMSELAMRAALPQILNVAYYHYKSDDPWCIVC